MRAVSYAASQRLPELTERPDPACPADGVLIAVRATGVCRSDWHAWMGHDPVALPHIPGHEFAGEVVEVGAGVRRVAVGQRVTVPFVLGCGRCSYCQAGDAQVCPDQRQPGFTDPGSFAELIAIDRADLNVVVLPDRLTMIAAAALGCRFATAYRALTVHGRVRAGQWVAVYGCGGVGLSAVLIARALGARVVAIDVDPVARQRAAELGAETLIDAGAGDVAAAVREATGDGAHVSLDAVGSALTATASVLGLRRRGRHIQVGLLFGAAAAPALPMDRVIAHELEIYGSHGMAAVDYPGMLDLVATGRLDPGRLVGRTIGLADAGRALAELDHEPGFGLTVVTVGSA